MLRRLDKDVILLKPDIIIIAIGTNDIFARLSANPSSTPVAFQATMTQIFSKLQLNLLGTPVFAIGMTTPLRKYAHIRFGDFLPQQEVVQAVFNDHNNILRELTKEYNFFYVDLPSQWPGNIEEGWEFYADGIHPNNAGYDFMTEILYEALTPTVLHPSQKNETRKPVIP